MKTLGWALVVSLALHAALFMLCPFPDYALPTLEGGHQAVMVTLSPASKSLMSGTSPTTPTTLAPPVIKTGRNPAAEKTVTPKAEASQESHTASTEQAVTSKPSNPLETVPPRAIPKAKAATRNPVKEAMSPPRKAAAAQLAPAGHPSPKPESNPSVGSEPANTILGPSNTSEDNPAETFSALGGRNDAAGTLQDGGTTVVEAKPLYRQNAPPTYPRLARRKGYEGKVLMDVLVSADGDVADIKIATSSGYRILDRAALKAVQAWRFEPGHRVGQKVAMWVKVPIRFRLD